MFHARELRESIPGIRFGVVKVNASELDRYFNTTVL